MEKQKIKPDLVTIEEIERDVPNFRQVMSLGPNKYLSKQYWSIPRTARIVYYKLAAERGLLTDRRIGAFTVLCVTLGGFAQLPDEFFPLYFTSAEAARNFIELFYSQPSGYDKKYNQPEWGKWFIVQITDTFTCEKFAKEQYSSNHKRGQLALLLFI